jgi:hypothetical protein
MEPQEATGPAKSDEAAPEPITVHIELTKAGVVITGNLPASRYVTLGMLEEAKIQLIGFYGQERMKKQMVKDSIVKPGESGFHNWMKNLGRKK